MQLESGRVAIVTGGASGIGRALAQLAAAAGMRLVLVDIRDEPLQETARALRAAGAWVEPVLADVACREDITRVADAAFAAGSVQLICSNAGIVVPGRVWELPDDDWRRVLDTNLLATVRLVQAFFPRLLPSAARAHLLVTGSMACVTARPGIGAYVAAKHGLLGLCEALQHELAEANAPIGVTLLMPGLVMTDMTDANLPPGAISAERAAQLAMDAVAEDRLIAFTQPDRLPAVERRFASIISGRTPESPA